MSNLEEVIDQLWLHNTFSEDPWTVDRAFAAIKEHGEVAIDALIWALGQKDFGLKLLALRLLREFGPEANRALPAVIECLTDENRLVRLTAQEHGVVRRQLVLPFSDNYNSLQLTRDG